MINIREYFNKKEKGLCQIKKIDNNYYIYEKRFNEITGDEKEGIKEFININEFLIEKLRLEERLEEINNFLDELPKTIINSKLEEIYG